MQINHSILRTVKFDIRNYLDKLAPSKDKNRYICPVCGGNNLTIDTKEKGKEPPAYKCWNGCECRDIREAIAPWEDVKRNCSNTHNKSNLSTESDVTLHTNASAITEIQIVLAELPNAVTHPIKQQGDKIEIEYPYSPSQWVLRTEKPEGKKVTIPYHLNSLKIPTKGKGNEPWHPYRLEEVKAYGAAKWVLGVEGEKCVEVARSLGLVAFTLQGGSWGKNDLATLASGLKAAGIAGIVYFPDNDVTGYKKASAVGAATLGVEVPFVEIDPIALWPECPDKGDIADWVKWGMEQGWDKQEFISRLEKQFARSLATESERSRFALDSFTPKNEFVRHMRHSLYGDKPWICFDNKLHFWTGTHYEHSPDAVEIGRIATWCDSYSISKQDPDTGEVTFSYPYAKPSKVEEAMKWLKMRLVVDPRKVNPQGLNCTNGVLQIIWEEAIPTWKLIDHTPDLYYAYEPQVLFDPEADAQWCDRLLEVLDAPQRDIFLKTIAASLDLATVRQHKGRLVRGLLLKGHGSNGKDTLREAVSMLYGRQGMTNCTLGDFNSYDRGRKFPLARLKHSRCNWASENASSTNLDQIQSLKAFITGDTYAKPSKVEEAMKWLKMRLVVDPRKVNPQGLNCTNGVLQIIWEEAIPTWKLIDHTRDLYYAYEPQVLFDPEADAQWCDRLLEVLDAPQRDIFLKTIAASLDLATVRQHKGRLVRGLLLKGHGSNGKDTLREAVSMLYGRQGMTNCTLGDFNSYDRGRKFPLARLKHSRCNWASENASSTNLDQIQSLKAFITGDTLSAEGKGRDEREFEPTAVALFNVNDTPKLQGTLEAIASRYGILSFNKTFKIGANPTKGELEADPRYKYDPNFLRSKVLSSFLNRVLDALQRLMTEGINYSCTNKVLEEIQAENSHLFQFAQDTGLQYDPNGILSAGEIWERLEAWYQDNGTLTHEEGSNGKRKAIWADQALRSDRNVKAANQVIARFRSLFPKAKLVTVLHESGKRNLQALQGIGFIESHTSCTPVARQSPHQETPQERDFHTTHTNSLDPVKITEISESAESKEITTYDPVVQLSCNKEISCQTTVITGTEDNVKDTQTQTDVAQAKPATQKQKLKIRQGEAVRYIGEIYSIYKNILLKINQIEKRQGRTHVNCLQPDGYLTTWLRTSDLEPWEESFSG